MKQTGRTQTEYRYVYKNIVHGKYIRYKAQVMHKNILLSSHHTDIREAAKAVDLYLIQLGLEPVNILKRK